MAIDRRGAILDDFRTIRRERAIHVRNTPSPAATACLAIGDHVANLATASGFLLPA